tara:strand:- start:640 stop:921 length:282 start_codon:yes stop_codon:yes gene_type:complete
MRNNFINALKQRLQYNKIWLNQFNEYYFHKSITKKVSKEMGRENPVIYFLINFYYFPINLIKYFTRIKELYTYKTILKETELIEKELNKKNLE